MLYESQGTQQKKAKTSMTLFACLGLKRAEFFFHTRQHFFLHVSDQDKQTNVISEGI